MSRRKSVNLAPWQASALRDLKEAARRNRADLHVGKPSVEADGDVRVEIELDTSSIVRGEGGVALRDRESFTLRIPASPFVPPAVDVAHTRFLGVPHVLQGTRLCIYLDPSREWHPLAGITPMIERLWGWLVEAAAGGFSAGDAMYHAVGGVLHRAPDTPTVVAREEVGTRRYAMSSLAQRSELRFDLHASDPDAAAMPLVGLFSDLPLGASESLLQLLYLIDHPTAGINKDDAFGSARLQPAVAPAFSTMLVAAALRNRIGSEQYFTLAIPHPGGGPSHLLAGRLPAGAADALRRAGSKRGTALDLSPALAENDVPIEWCNMSDERAAVTTRRDVNRPVNGFAGKTVHIWGCGGLGSWIAEFVVRAGARDVTVCDPGTVTGGLLVRQNYNELDIGADKARALAAHLRGLRDDVEVHSADGAFPESAEWLSADVVIDATVSNAVATIIDQFAMATDQHPLLVQVATDVGSGTLGILTVSPPNSRLGPSATDQLVGGKVSTDPELELYHCLWRDPLGGEEIVPTRGCSAPTFHGSAADLAAVSGVLTSLIGGHIGAVDGIAGAHLIALPHAAAGPRHHFVRGQPDEVIAE